MARWRRGNAGVCKTSMRRFDSGTRLTYPCLSGVFRRKKYDTKNNRTKNCSYIRVSLRVVLGADLGAFL